MITIQIGPFPIGIDNRYDQTWNMRFFLCDRDPLFTVSVSEAELEAEKRISPFPDDYLEFVCAYRKIAERLPEFGAFVLHGAAVCRNDRAYIFTAPSGTGKTTHATLWMRTFSDTWILNGDKPVICRKDGIFYACGTPWKGKEQYGQPQMRPVGSICLLRRAPDNEIRRISGREFVLTLLQQIYRPSVPENLERTLLLLDEFCAAVPAFELKCNPDPSAAILSCRTMTGQEPNFR